MLVDAQKQTVGTGAVSAFGLSHYGNSLFCPKQPRFRNTCEKCGLAGTSQLDRVPGFSNRGRLDPRRRALLPCCPWWGGGGDGAASDRARAAGRAWRGSSRRHVAGRGGSPGGLGG